MSALTLQDLITDTKNVLIFRYTTVATVCLVTLEYLINFDYEVRYLWLRRFNFGSALLFFCRYLPVAQIYASLNLHVLANDVRPAHCLTLLKINLALVFLSFCLSNMVLYLRAYAVWGGSKKILLLLASTYLASFAGSAFTLHLYIKGSTVPGLRLWDGCIFLITDNSIFYAMVGHAILDTCALVLLLYKSFQHARFMRSLESDGNAKVSILTVMAQDGIAYFIFNLACTITNLIVLERVSDALHDFLFHTQACVQVVLCARLHFHVQIVNDGLDPNVTSVMGPIGTSMEMKGFDRRRYEVQSEIKFIEEHEDAPGYTG